MITKEELEYLGFDCYELADGEYFYDLEMCKKLNQNTILSVIFISDSREISLVQRDCSAIESIIDLPIKTTKAIETLINLYDEANDES